LKHVLYLITRRYGAFIIAVCFGTLLTLGDKLNIHVMEVESLKKKSKGLYSMEIEKKEVDLLFFVVLGYW